MIRLTFTQKSRRLKSENVNLTPTLVKVEFLIGGSVESFNVYEVTIHVRVIQRAECHVCRGRSGSVGSTSKLWLDRGTSVSIPTGGLLFFDGWGHRGVALHARCYNDLRGGHSDHGRGSGSRRGRHGNCSLLHGLLGGFRGNWHSAVFIQLPLDSAFDLSPADAQHSGDDTQ